MASIITLNADQQHVSDRITAALEAPGASMLLLKGFAGTGKTSTLMSALAKRRDVLFLTPSHASKRVILDAAPTADVMTLHAALGAQRVVDRRSGYVCFRPEGAGRIPELLARKSVIVLDECSMVGGGWFEHLLTVLGLLDKSGARYLEPRFAYVQANSDELSRVTELLYGRGLDPQDVLKDPSTARRIVGRPQQKRLDGTTLIHFSWRVEGGRKPIKLIVMGDPAQLPPVTGEALPGDHPAWSIDPDRAWALREGFTRRTTSREGGDVLDVELDRSPSFNAALYDEVLELRKIMRAASDDLERANLLARSGVERGAPHRLTEASARVELVKQDDIIERAVELYRRQEDVVCVCWRNRTKNSLASAIRRALLGEHLPTDSLHPGEPIAFSAPYQAINGTQRFDNGDLAYIVSREGGFYANPTFPELSTPYFAHLVRIASRPDEFATIWFITAQQRRALQDLIDKRRDAFMHDIDLLELEAARPSTSKARRVEIIDMINALKARVDALYSALDSFALVESSYTRTAHKAQGGSWHTVIYHQSDVLFNRRKLDAAKMAYVAISRARQRLIVVTP